MAQNKAVAITEVVDKEDKVPYAVEIMVRTRLTAAISMKQGYNAYDRVDLQTLVTEHNFQRTGLVDDATIKKTRRDDRGIFSPDTGSRRI